MKIGFDAKRFFHNSTGLGNYSRNLIALLSTYYPENEYILYNPKKSKKFSLDNFPKSVQEKKPTTFLSKKFPAFWRSFFIKNQIAKDNISIYHGLSGEIPLFLSSKRCKKIVTVHDLIFMRYPNLYTFFDKNIHQLKFKYAIKNSNGVVAISEQTKQDIVNFFKVDAKKIKVIYQGCNAIFKTKYSEIEKNNVLKKYNLPQNFILNVGTIEKRKNALNIVKAINNTDIPLVIIGKKTAYFQEIMQYIDEHNLNNQVFFLKGISEEELAILYQTSQFFVYPSIFEGFGIPIIEALYSKTPVITSTGSCFHEAGGPDSIYVNPENPDELKKEIVALWNNPEKRKMMIEKGFVFVQKFNDEVIANEWQEYYLKTIN